jgi:hypothetical protein
MTEPARCPECRCYDTERHRQICGRLDPFENRVMELREQGFLITEIGADTGRSTREVRLALARILAIAAEIPIRAE